VAHPQVTDQRAALLGAEWRELLAEAELGTFSDLP